MVAGSLICIAGVAITQRQCSEQQSIRITHACTETIMSVLPTNSLFEGFSRLDHTTTGVHFAGVMGGDGPPVLLLHGYPETHATWHAVAPALAQRFSIVAPDLPGYGRSLVRNDGAWAKRDVATELVSLMQSLGHRRFAVVGHDRGARVGYRLALDFPQQVTAYCSIAVVPTLDVWPAVDREFAKRAFHWFLFAQPGDLPERLLAADPDAFLDDTLDHMAHGLSSLHQIAVADYREAFAKASVRRAIIKDYRAAYDIDVQHDAADRRAGRKIACPVLVLWPRHQRLVADRGHDDVLTPGTVWRRWADDVREVDIDGGHLLPEQAPEAVVETLISFLAQHGRE
ncbi:alpha/beta fold hydrolase [Bradyrhizobium oligotrophicum]|uniref:alpha/beta fold hydrolase n=1 Tax=Bradyrhizobium oligotrophicum TaxID=44255 RepID=UPI003EB7BECE